MDSKKVLFKSAAVMGSATFISRILGFIRDMVIARFLGTSMYADAFFVAFRIPNFLRRLFGEGSLTASFIPIFTKYHVKKGKKSADEIASVSFTLLFLILLILTSLGIIFSPVLVKIIAPGFEKELAKFTLTVKLNRIMFPYILFISLVALCMGILNSLKHFFAPAIAPALLNVSIITAAFLSFFLHKNIVFGIAYGVILGGVLQLILQLLYLKKFNIKLRFNINFSHPAIKEILLLMGPSVIGLAITQINILINTLLASFLPTGSISYLYYADRLIQFPLGIFAVSIGSAVLPLLSEQSAQNSLHEMQHTFIYGLKLIFLITFPAIVGLIIAGKPIISCLFQRGAFHINDLENVYLALIGYAIGLWAYSGLRVIVPVYYAFKDTKTPVKVGFLALIINVIFSIILMKFLLHMGLAIATAVSSTFNFLCLMFLVKKYINIKFYEIIKYVLKISIPAIILAIFLKLFLILFKFNYFWSFYLKFFYIILMVLIAIGIYWICCTVFKIEEISFRRK